MGPASFRQWRPNVLLVQNLIFMSFILLSQKMAKKEDQIIQEALFFFLIIVFLSKSPYFLACISPLIYSRLELWDNEVANKCLPLLTRHLTPASQRRRHLLWFTVSVDSVHGQWAVSYSPCGGRPWAGELLHGGVRKETSEGKEKLAEEHTLPVLALRTCPFQPGPLTENVRLRGNCSSKL